MNKLLLLLFVLLLGLICCNNNDKSDKKFQSFQTSDSCSANAENTYEIYIPQSKNLKEKLPLLVIIDPHGNAKYALKKFKQSADEYQIMLVASNVIKNNFIGYKEAIQTLVDDVRRKHETNNILFIAGFSGGARMALDYATDHQVDGLVACGALASADQIEATHCLVISISGMDDFNFIETAHYLLREQSVPKNLAIELTETSHDWPDSMLLANSLGFLSLPHFTKKSSIAEYCKEQHARIDTLKKQGDIMKATQIARSMSLVKPFSNDVSFISLYEELNAYAEYSAQIQQLKACLSIEMNARKLYIDAFDTKDSLWWKNEIERIDKKIEAEHNSVKRSMYLRIKAFWGIACYTFCKRATREQNASSLQKIILIYRMLEPKNPDMLYFSAFLYSLQGDDAKTILYLRNALKAGFFDMSRLEKDFPRLTLKIKIANN